VSESWADPLAVRATDLERQVRFLLRRGYRPASAGPLLNAQRTLHVTFDDAFRSIAAVLPVLERLEVPVTVFACTAYADGGRPLDVPELRLRGAGAGDELATLSWDALRELAARGVEIGSHTISHPHLPDLADTDLRRELQLSKDQLESELGRRCRFLAYPYGEHDLRVRAVAAAAGYAAAFTLNAPRRPTDRLAVGRVDIYRGDGPLRFAAKTSRLRPPAAVLLRRLRRNPRP
jgi:peptidoglycan/xylan/chitin deacetylase (PgdA/CDA1 family)